MASATATDDALGLAAGQPARQVVEAIGEADLREQLPCARGGPVAAGELDRQLDVLDRGQERDQVAALQHDADPPAPQPRARRCRRAR